MEMTIFLDPHFHGDEAKDVTTTITGLTLEQFEALAAIVKDTTHYDWR
jgi:hypothetical protein